MKKNTTGSEMNKLIKNDNQFTDENKFLNFVIFQTEKGKVNIDVFFYDETLWLTQKKIAELFEKGRSTITEHLNKIFDDGELDERVVCRDFRHTTKHGAIEGKTQMPTCIFRTFVNFLVTSSNEQIIKPV
jgi:phage regulator Rha-like protein